MPFLTPSALFVALRPNSTKHSSRKLSLFATGLLAGTLQLCALSQGLLAFADPASEALTPEEEAKPTPISEFAPESTRPSASQPYDQGLTISDVEIAGNRLVNENTIKDAMAIRPGALYSRNTLQQDLRRVYDMGYFTDNIKATPVATNKGIVVRIEVEENAPVTQVNIEGNSLIPDDELIALFKTQTGMPQNVTQLNEAISKIEKKYAEQGYVLAKVTSIADDPDGSVNLKINEGTVDHVYFSGNKKTHEDVLRRNITTEAGKVYNENQIKDDMKRLYSIQAFSDVRRVITPSTDDPSKFDVTLEVDEKRTSALSLGGGLDSGTGIFGSVGFSDPNFLGHGQDVRSVFSVGSGVLFRDRDTQASARTFQFELGWSTPSFLGTDNALSSSLYGRNLASFNVPLGIERRIGAEVGWSRAIKNHPNLAFNMALRGEGVDIKEGASQSLLNRLNVNRNDRVDQLEGGKFLSLSPTLAYDTRDNRFDPTRGWLNTIGITGAYGIGNDSYGSANVNLRRYIKLSEKTTLALNAQAGRSLIGDIPAFNAFRMGGTQSVRGFQEGGLGIGNGFLMGSAEVRSEVPFIGAFKDKLPLLNGLKSALFIDAGQLFDESSINSAFNRPGLGVSIGAGLRMNIPGVGPIRIDYALPISSNSSRYRRRFNFGLGQKF
ncbi:MAG: BamA/TamA family outer membrane protein [Vampirovibrionales bacterium]|nr:BamA/TamA family outer membrane protein [Vampirovibrionales bacterium]